MKSFFSNITSIKSPSLILVLLPYLFSHLREFAEFEEFSYFHFFLILAGAILLHISIVKLYSSESIYNKYIGLLVLLLILSTFYISDITEFLLQIQIEFFQNPLIKLRWLTVLVLFSSTVLLLLLYRANPIWIRFQNVFFLILSVFSIIDFSKKSLHEPMGDFDKNAYLAMAPSKPLNAPVYLIILDAYSSPDELFKVSDDSSIFDFSNDLKSNKWIVKNSIPSYHSQTELAISSLFNFNLSKNQSYEKSSYNSLPFDKLSHATLIDSLSRKQVSFVNYGIFPIAGQLPLTRAYFLPRNTFEIFISRTVLNQVISYASNFELSHLNTGFYPFHVHNEKEFQKLYSIKQPVKTFIYSHFYMPHTPYYYGKEFPFKRVNMENYISYWRFANSKIAPVLDHLSKSGAKVILASDHGFRMDTRINKLNSFAAFYGFDSSSVEAVKSIQDIGSLINGQFRK